MRKTLLLLNFTLACANIFGQTNVSGNVSGTWTKAQSPYVLTGYVAVLTGQTSVIQPGVVAEMRQLMGGYVPFYTNLVKNAQFRRTIFYSNPSGCTVAINWDNYEKAKVALGLED